MTDSELTASLEDYLESIYELSVSNEAVRASDIAEKLKVKRPSVTNALQALQKKGMLHYDPYTAVTLTETGKKEAAKILHRHRAMAFFLEKILGLESERAQQAACRIEHAIDSEITTRLVEFIELLDSCPRTGFDWLQDAQYHCRQHHNNKQCAQCMERAAKRIPNLSYNSDLMAIHHGSISLNEVVPGSSVLIVSLGKDKKTAKELQKRGIIPNLHVVVSRINDHDQSIELESKERKWLLTQEETAALEVLPCDPT